MHFCNFFAAHLFGCSRISAGAVPTSGGAFADLAISVAVVDDGGAIFRTLLQSGPLQAAASSSRRDPFRGRPSSRRHKTGAANIRA
jgi:hypothetical protein